ncbi:hypothetical protein BO83DRAFT_403484 [Aspergillus eucalypticola CBS 122712]|uniref:Uncharacterized protein n=1 Tax=Aspergillus eucalypticola (strain CBS 122712 / IBT 29274) TaxID=1448314 RepID=A0A317US95_ASPEC|nr:uncharacterized protein BO83DRAFT_403484 [Aspergillus eucalypticola CBS 122712]PWY62930.1 hypothetical protein BO83DRAFT_403484 [Aspergillus eucalypticola CBS 122712]
MDNEWLSWWKRRQTCAGLVALGGFAEYGVLERENAPDLPECQVVADPNVDKEEPTIPDSKEREELAKKRQTGTGSGKQGMGRDRAANDGRLISSGDSVISAKADAEKSIIRSIALQQRYQRLQELCHPLRCISWVFAFPTLRSPQRLRTICVGGVSWSAALGPDGLCYHTSYSYNPFTNPASCLYRHIIGCVFFSGLLHPKHETLDFAHN